MENTKNIFHSLGEISLEQKKEIWKNKMSGSQVKRILSDTMNLYNEKMGNQEIVDLSKTKAARWLEMGNIMEPHIVALAKEIHSLDIQTDKSTFVSDIDDWYTANIDGYLGANINEIETIIEIKNTTDDDVDSLLQKYIWQITYYMWFFNAKNAKLVALVKGNDLKVIDIERDMDREREMLDFIDNFKISLDMGVEPTVKSEDAGFVSREVSAEALAHDKEIDAELLEKYIDAKKELDDAAANLDEIKKEINTKLSKYGKWTTYVGTTQFTKSTIIANGKVDYKAICEKLIKETGKDAKTLFDEYRKESVQQNRISIKEVK